MNGHCLFKVMVWLIFIFLDCCLSEKILTPSQQKAFCFRTNTISDGEIHYMFLHQTVGDDEQSVFLFDTLWSRERDPVDCIKSNDQAVIESYRVKCWEAGGRPFSETPDRRFNISKLVEPSGHCVQLEHLEGHGVSVRRARDLESVNGQRRHIQIEKEGTSPKLRRSKRSWMIPGTLWCGSGSEALEFADLGVFEETDKCCRAHDHCEETIASFEYSYGVFNSNIFTLSHCDCDKEFRHCLHSANDSMSDLVGYGYFNFLKMRCFEFAQRMQCAQRSWWGMCQLSQMTRYALLKEPVNYNSTFPELEEDKLNLTLHHTISLGDMGDTTGLTVSSTPLADNTGKGHSVSVWQWISSKANLPQLPDLNRISIQKQTFKTLSNTQTHISSRIQSDPLDLQTDSRTVSPCTQIESQADSLQTQPNSPQTPNDSQMDPSHRESTQTQRHSQTDSSTKSQTDSPQTQTDSRTHLPQAQNDTRHILTNSSTDLPESQMISIVTLADQTGITQAPRVSTYFPEIHNKQKDYMRMCSSYKDLDSCHYQIPAQQEKFGLHNTEHTTLYHCNCTARLARELAEQDAIDKVHRLLFDFVSQLCFNLPKKCTGSQSCSVTTPPLVERWTKDEAVWRHLAASKRKPKRLNAKRAKRKDTSFKLYKKCVRIRSKLHTPNKHQVSVSGSPL